MKIKNVKYVGKKRVMNLSVQKNHTIISKNGIVTHNCDHPNLAVSQQSLRQLIEDVQKTTQFILVCNYINNIIPELKSRCQVYEISNPPAKDIFKRCDYILKNEKITYNKKTIVNIIKKTYPDIRNTIISLRQNTIDGKLKENVVISSSDDLFYSILNAMLTGDPEEVRKILKSNTIFYPELYDYIYKQIMEKDSVFKDDAEAILLIGEHAYRDNIVAIKEINFMHLVFQMIGKGVI